MKFVSEILVVLLEVYRASLKGVRAFKGLFWPPLEPKTKNCLSPISFNWFNRRITEV